MIPILQIFYILPNKNQIAMSYYYNDYNEKKTYQNVESGQLIQLKKTATNVVESGKVIVCPEKKNYYRPIPSPPPEPADYQESSPTCASGITYLSRRKGSYQQSDHLIQIYEIAPNNIINLNKMIRLLI